ncbi:transcription initiation factor IIE [Marinisporobacter balticus]|uniref:Amphi-Trp domain-containing protein n=1 Tax=Marinisporobacter balticus TaxID=2018667 RepID=A0A4R2KLX5_9FIRM|nr:transcription initiation factor IIE [Marinisporobacter balticus]TCO71028.1 hypothetical protein EV214_12316 [Marinisporobacter balticus]
MRYREKFVGNVEEIHEQLKETFGRLVRGTLEVEEAVVALPKDKTLEYKVKYEDGPEGQLAVKISWSDLVEEEEEEEEEFEI